MMLLLATAALAATWTAGIDAPTLQETLALAADGDTVEVPDGTWPGPVLVDRAITLTSTGGVIDGGGEGSVVRVSAPGAALDGLRVQNSGQDLRGPDACVYLEPSAVGATVRGSELEECAFGIWVHEGREVLLEDNRIRSRPLRQTSNRGNGIQLFDGRRLVVRGNHIEGARDGIYVGATHDSRIEGNHASNVRYGIHYMYSYDNHVVGNVMTGNTGGIALMQSLRLTVVDNVSTDNERRGILFRDVRYSTIRGNRVERNGEGLFFFSSLDNVIEGNLISDNEVGARVWAGTSRNVITGNDFVGNRQQIFYVAREDQVWGTEEDGNYWSDYLGWDQDGDGLGDRPYQADSLLANLLYTYPTAALLLSSPALELLRWLQARMPVLRTPTVIDPHPRMRPGDG